MKRSLRYNLVDVFTDTPLRGNPLAVFTMAKGISPETMQDIARELNLSETVFFLPPEGGGHARLRIFTPRTELPFAGHPVLGSAWVLAGPMEMNTLRLETGKGLISVELERQGDRLHRAHMSQPLPHFSNYPGSESSLRKALGLPERTKHAALLAENGPSHVLVEADSPEQVQDLSPDFSTLARLCSAGTLVFARSGDGIVTSRYFAPAAGIHEDPATGSAAGPLGAHLVVTGRLAAGEELVVHQGEKMMRPSTLFVRAFAESGEITRVTVGGSAVVIGRGELLLA
jgi:trans-2,3-dihydro-3-hydroxyanthranilate isomerase